MASSGSADAGTFGATQTMAEWLLIRLTHYLLSLFRAGRCRQVA